MFSREGSVKDCAFLSIPSLDELCSLRRLLRSHCNLLFSFSFCKSTMVFTRHRTETKDRKKETDKKAYKVRRRVTQGKRTHNRRFDSKGQSVCVKERFDFLTYKKTNMKALKEANGTIFRWYRETVSPCGSALLSTLNLPTKCRFVMEINCAYSPASTKAQL